MTTTPDTTTDAATSVCYHIWSMDDDGDTMHRYMQCFPTRRLAGQHAKKSGLASEAARRVVVACNPQICPCVREKLELLKCHTIRVQ